jgi:hypothetical protein
MHRMWFTLSILVVVVAIQPATTQVRAVDAERLLAGRFGFTPAEVAQARSGRAVAKLLPRNDSSDVGVLGAVQIDAQASRLVTWFKDIASFRNAAELGVSRRLSDPPQIADFADLSLDSSEIGALRACRPGNCELNLGDAAVARFKSDVDWSSADAARRATLVMRQLLLEQAQAYLKGGDPALGAVHTDKQPRARADEFHQVLWQSKGIYDIAPPLAAYLEGFPTARLPESEQFLYWAKGAFGPDASITLHQLIVYHAPGGEVFIADKQLYASRYVDAALTVISLVSTPDGKSFYVLAGARARSTMLNGVAARLLRGKIEKATQDTAAMYLNWVRASLLIR